ncbi:MAG: helix-turn-helix transcriptional regulator [Mogibacterium sp.]|nr:helix-turn-helix transcriptional regulator [Mogibacterium sp.]
MKYRKHHSKSYNPRIFQITIGDYTVQINYSEITDESCLEFSHVHNDYEIYYCLEGTMHLMVGDEYVEMEKNQFTIVEPGVSHNTLYEPKHPKKYFILVFEKPEPVKGAAMTYSITDSYISEVIKRIDKTEGRTFSDTLGCQWIIKALGTEMESDGPGHDDMIRAFYTQYLIHIFRNLDITVEDAEMKSERRTDNINLALELTRYMHENYNKNISIKDAAETFHISERHVGRIFDKYFGTSFKHTLNIYRINYSKNYLLDTDYSIEKIASLVGISSTRKFYELFREMEQMSASKYRKLHKGDSSHYGVPKNEE